MNVNVNSIASWPPGALMSRDSSERLRYGGDGHVGTGLVVANDGTSRVCVVWDEKTNRGFEKYDVAAFNERVISRLR